MKHIKSLLLLLLLPMAIFMTSCNNEVPEEYLLEVDPNSEPYYDPDDPFAAVAFFVLTLYKLPDDYDPYAPYLNPGKKIFEDYRLNKGDILRLEDLEYGKYRLTGYACNIQNGGEYVIPGGVSAKCNNMDENGYMVVEPGVPVIVKLLVYYGS